MQTAGPAGHDPEEGMQMISKILRVGVAALLTLSVAGAVPALAKDGDVIRRGACSGASDWKLKLSPEDGKIEVEYEVDSNKVGQTWQVRIVKNGNVIFRGARETKGASGSFAVRLVTANTAGSDVFRARATHADEVCAGSATF
jgi:hypothetical protein